MMCAELKAKEASMKELVRLAEEAEARTKGDLAALLDSRNAMLEAMASYVLIACLRLDLTV